MLSFGEDQTAVSLKTVAVASEQTDRIFTKSDRESSFSILDRCDRFKQQKHTLGWICDFKIQAWGGSGVKKMILFFFLVFFIIDLLSVI